MGSVKNILDKFLLGISSLLLIFLLAGAVWQVFTRFVMGNPSVMTEEILRFSLIWIAFLGASYTFGSNEHLSLNFIREKFKGKAYRNIRIFNDIIVFLFALFVLLIGGSIIVNVTLTELSPISGVPMGWIYIVLPLSGIVTMIYQIINILEWKNAPLEGSEQ